MCDDVGYVCFVSPAGVFLPRFVIIRVASPGSSFFRGCSADDIVTVVVVAAAAALLPSAAVAVCYEDSRIYMNHPRSTYHCFRVLNNRPVPSS